MKKKIGKIYTIKQAAELLRYSQEYMLDLVQQKIISAIRVGRGRGTWRIYEEELQRFIEKKHLP